MTPTDESLVVVEDDEALRRLLEQALVHEGFSVRTAPHGAEALQILNTITPALVILDLVLPWVNGLEVLASMRGSDRLRHVPVLVVTGTATQPRDLQSYQPVAVMYKPLNTEALKPAIQQMLSGFRLR